MDVEEIERTDVTLAVEEKETRDVTSGVEVMIGEILDEIGTQGVVETERYLVEVTERYLAEVTERYLVEGIETLDVEVTEVEMEIGMAKITGGVEVPGIQDLRITGGVPVKHPSVMESFVGIKM